MTTAGWFVTGTDTGVGKTVVSCALLHALAARGHSVAGMKPVAAGCENGRWQDVELLIAASNYDAPRALINPYAFTEPIAPHIAAQQAGQAIDLDVIQRSHANLRSQVDVTIVEGAGGFLVPLGSRHDISDLARALGLPIILVVGMRLGCLNHALLTCRAIHAAGLTLAGWVANRIDPAMLQPAENLRALIERLDCPLLGVLPHQAPVDIHYMANQIDLSKLGLN
ncbi:MAG: dethiobiotin synthase [Nitrosomonas halophila]|nr:dethiobiotin synthase [Nitrosomonas halophila]